MESNTSSLSLTHLLILIIRMVQDRIACTKKVVNQTKLRIDIHESVLYNVLISSKIMEFFLYVLVNLHFIHCTCFSRFIFKTCTIDLDLN